MKGETTCGLCIQWNANYQSKKNFNEKFKTKENVSNDCLTKTKNIMNTKNSYNTRNKANNKKSIEFNLNYINNLNQMNHNDTHYSNNSYSIPKKRNYSYIATTKGNENDNNYIGIQNYKDKNVIKNGNNKYQNINHLNFNQINENKKIQQPIFSRIKILKK